MNLFDKLIKILKTDRNTFVTFILTLLSFYIVTDRIVEMLLIGFSGISHSYWGPIKYTFALACPIFAFYFSFSSKLVTYKKLKLECTYLYITVLYVIVLSMAVQWINYLGWAILFSAPNYKGIISGFMELLKPAFTAIAWYLPICTAPALFNLIYCDINDTKLMRDSIGEFKGINLSTTKNLTGPYTFEIPICFDTRNGTTIKVPDNRRYESMVIVGNSGSGKTSMIFEPMIARDLEKKLFLKEASKELGFTALKTGIAYLNCPFSNDYINENFSLNMITPSPNKESLYRTYLSKLIIDYNGSDTIYKTLGLTYLAPDNESIKRVTSVADNLNIKYHLIDPEGENNVGLNPFAGDNPVHVSMLISSILKKMYTSNLESTQSAETLVANTNLAGQAIENLCFLLKEIYPAMNDEKLPTLEHLLALINDFTRITKYINKIKETPALAKKYEFQIQYLEKNFAPDAPGKDEMYISLKSMGSQIEQLLYHQGVRNILCNQTNNLNYNKILSDGEIVFVSTRRGELGTNIHKAFGLYIILLMQQAVLIRPGSESSRIPHFLYIDEFAPFATKSCLDLFTLYRKYRVGVIVSGQNLNQFGTASSNVRQTILANATTKITFGNNSPEDNKWWSEEFGVRRDFKWNSDYQTEKGSYSSDLKSIQYYWKPNIKAEEIQLLPFKSICFKTKDVKGSNVFGKGKVDFLESKYKEKKKSKIYNFSKFTSGITPTATIDDSKDDNDVDRNPDIDPISTNYLTFKSNIKFENEDPIINLKNNSNNN